MSETPSEPGQAQPNLSLGGIGSTTVGALQTAIGFALGFAAADALGPVSATIRQEAWRGDPSLVLEPQDLARALAQALLKQAEAEGGAQQSGLTAERFDTLYQTQLVAPPVGTLLELLRRGELKGGAFTHGLRKNQYEEQWDDLFRKLQTTPLDLGVISTAVHRGIMAGDGLIVVSPPTGAGKVPSIPVSTIDPVTAAAWWGQTKEQLRVRVATTGLPLSLGEMLQLLNRGEVTDNDVKRAIAESNIRNEYMDVALNLARHILTPHEYAEADLRGILTPAQAEAGAALSGLNKTDYALLFGILGRPLSAHQITTGLARGGKYGGTYDDVPAGPYRDAIRRSAIRPEYASLAYADRYTYPSGFQIKSEAPELGFDVTHKLLLEVGWDPKWAEFFAKKWTGTATTATVDKHVAKAQTQAWSKLHSSYVDSRTSDQQATTWLPKLGVDPAAVPEVLALWKLEQQIVRAGLSAASIKKEATEKLMTAAEAEKRLMELGYSQADAKDYLAQ